MGKNIIACGEIENGTLKSISLQLASKATALAEASGASSAAALLGRGASSFAAVVAEAGPSTIFTGDSDVYDTYLTQPTVDTLAAIVSEQQPELLLIPDTSNGRDIGARLAARLNLPLEYHVNAIEFKDGAFIFGSSAFGGQMNITFAAVGSGTKVVIVGQNAFKATKNSGQTFQTIALTVPSIPANGAKISGPFGTEYATEEGHLGQEDGKPQYIPPAARSNIEEASIIVSGGRGVGGPEGFAMIDELAKALGGAVGASRPVTDDGWLPHRHHIGQTGHSVKPDVYLACGISGAVQHQAGMQTSKYIIAINKDKDAPIFTFCDLGVVGDLKVVIPELTKLVTSRHS